jgi:hypothetical protein
VWWTRGFQRSRVEGADVLWGREFTRVRENRQWLLASLFPSRAENKGGKWGGVGLGSDTAVPHRGREGVGGPARVVVARHR